MNSTKTKNLILQLATLTIFDEGFVNMLKQQLDDDLRENILDLIRGLVLLAEQYELRTEPFSEEEMAAANGNLVGVFGIDLSDLTEYDPDTFFDHLSEMVTGSIVGLQNINYKVVGCDGDTLHIEITGHVEDYEDYDEEE